MVSWRPLTRCICFMPVLLVCAVAFAAEWPPALDHKNAAVQTDDGRRIERYTHGARSEWGYAGTRSDDWRYPSAEETGRPGQNHNSFYVVSPKLQRQNAPLCVVLHSANRTGFDYLGFQFLDRKVDAADEPAAIMTRTPKDCYVLYLNSTNEEWYGWSLARQDPQKYATALTPPEKRLLDTIEWVITRYKIDRNRVYLLGVSMGGCAALGLGLARGNTFAAIFVDVPAGLEFAAVRFRLPPSTAASQAEQAAWTQRISGFGLPDPPIVVDLFATDDSWSETQPILLRAAQAGRLPLVAGWGRFGHTAFSTAVVNFPQAGVALAFPWAEIRKNAAYPVFTEASSNQRPPGIGSSTDFDESGQINAYFRWNNQQDKASRFTMQLWMAHPMVENSPPAMPDTSTTDITFRRFQVFKARPGRTYTWQLVRDGKTVASGSVKPDAANLLTIPQVTLSVVPAELSIRTETSTQELPR